MMFVPSDDELCPTHFIDQLPKSVNIHLLENGERHNVFDTIKDEQFVKILLDELDISKEEMLWEPHDKDDWT